MLIAFNNTENISGWNFYQILLLYGITRISIGFVAFCFDSMYEIGPKYIRNGEFDKILLRPVHPLISIIGSSRDFAGINRFVFRNWYNNFYVAKIKYSNNNYINCKNNDF